LLFRKVTALHVSREILLTRDPFNFNGGLVLVIPFAIARNSVSNNL
jgi:hypothetical protein